MNNTLSFSSVRLLNSFIRGIYYSRFGKLIITGIVAFIMSLILLLTVSIRASAGVGENPAGANATISYMSYHIQDGDTLWSIASEYRYGDYSTRDFVREIKTLNGLKKDTIHIGCYILVPVCTYD